MARKKDMWTGSGKFVRALKAPSQNVLVSLQRFSMLVITITLTEKKENSDSDLFYTVLSMSRTVAFTHVASDTECLQVSGRHWRPLPTHL
jgi:hypothetical protein